MERIYPDGIVLYQPHRHHRFGLSFSTHMANELVIDTGFFCGKTRR
jgi:hypothetical protein